MTTCPHGDIYCPCREGKQEVSPSRNAGWTGAATPLGALPPHNGSDEVVPPLSLWRHDVGCRHVPTMRRIAEEVAARRGVTVADMKGPRKPRPIAHARQEAMALMLETKLFSSIQVGAYFGGRDHTTALYGAAAHQRRAP